MKNYNRLLTFIFVGFIGLFFMLELVNKDKEFSPMENRNLAQMPKFTLERLFNGKFTSEFESYITDQFVFRDMWVGMKYVSERALLKTENKGIYLGSDGYLLSKFKEPASDRVNENFGYVQKLIDSLDVPVHFSLIPSSAYILNDKLPKYAVNYDQSILLNEAEKRFSKYFDIAQSLKEHKDEYIYYRTDHHWTSEGAFIGYNEVCKAMGLEPVSKPEILKEYSDFYGTLFSTSGARLIKGDTVTLYKTPRLMVKDENGKDFSLYDESYGEKKDKYSIFLGGNFPLLTVANEENPKGKELLLIKDSYSNSLVPFLSNNFSKIHIWDLRFNKTSIKEYVKANNIDEVLVLYSTENFSSDTNFFPMGK